MKTLCDVIIKIIKYDRDIGKGRNPAEVAIELSADVYADIMKIIRDSLHITSGG